MTEGGATVPGSLYGILYSYREPILGTRRSTSLHRIIRTYFSMEGHALSWPLFVPILRTRRSASRHRIIRAHRPSLRSQTSRHQRSLEDLAKLKAEQEACE